LRKLDQILREEEVAPPEVLERTFKEQFLDSAEARFERTLFHYLLTRLGRVGSKVAVDYCVEALRSRPDETEYMLRYLGSVGLEEHQVNRIVDFVESADALYDYQIYQIVAWFYSQKRWDERMVQLCRSLAFDRNRPTWLRSYCTAYLGEYSDSGDLAHLEEQYAHLTTDIERADCAAALKKQERGRRNAFYARIQGDGEYVQWAAQLVRLSI
jgi:hypothetical protein